MSVHNKFNDILKLVGMYYGTIKVYVHEDSKSAYLEESRHHTEQSMSLTNLMGTQHVREMLTTLKVKRIFIGYDPKHTLRHEPHVGGYWEYNIVSESFMFIGMDDNDFLLHLTLHTLAT